MDNVENQKLGSGIIAISVIQLIFSVIGILIVIAGILMKDVLEQQLQASGMNTAMPTTSQSIISILLTALIIFAIIMILLKKQTGVYAYFTAVVVNMIYSIISNGFNISLLIGLVLPALMAVFIIKKKEVFGFNS